MSSEAGGQEREAQRQLAESLGTPSYVDLTDEIARLEAALAASQERERQLREALEQIEQLDRMGHNSEVAAEMGYIARVTLAARRAYALLLAGDAREAETVLYRALAAYDEQVKP